MKLMQLITGMLLILVTGLFWGTWFALSRTMYHFPVEMFILIGKEIIMNVAAPMRIIMPASILGLLILLIGSRKRNAVYFFGVLISFILFLTALIITIAIEVPIDNQIKTWTAATVPGNWESIRDRWQTFHTTRTFVSLAGIAFFLIAIMNSSKRKPENT
jgi:uncharacterized membrane protein